MTKFGGTELPTPWKERLRHRVRLESQTMGVLAAFRGRHIAFLLKQVQAQQALARGIDVINWTADPLQFPNAALNFTRLGAVAYESQPDLYVFRNELNRVAASRLNLTWLVGSERVQRILSGKQPTALVDLAGRPEIVRVNDGPAAARFDADAPTIAFEIPADWTGLQRSDLPQAQRWREATDQLFGHYLGSQIGRYMITGAGIDRDRRYLVGQRVDEEFLESLCPISGSTKP
jgi:predicted GNAT superfamily acetyltransferase